MKAINLINIDKHLAALWINLSSNNVGKDVLNPIPFIIDTNLLETQNLACIFECFLWMSKKL